MWFLHCWIIPAIPGFYETLLYKRKTLIPFRLWCRTCGKLDSLQFVAKEKKIQCQCRQPTRNHINSSETEPSGKAQKNEIEIHYLGANKFSNFGVMKRNQPLENINVKWYYNRHHTMYCHFCLFICDLTYPCIPFHRCCCHRCRTYTRVQL